MTVLQGIFSLYSSGKFVTLVIYLIYTEAVSWRCSAKKVFLEILKSHMKTPVPESLFNKAVGVKPAILLKRDSDTGLFL